jgi:HAD superfamily hydrolase (TIGR01509 family)
VAVTLAAVFFDMDGLLVDTERLWHDAGTAVMSGYGLPWTEADSTSQVGGPLSRTSAYMAERTGATAAAMEVALVATMAELLASGTEHRPGAVELLDELLAEEVPCALVSASPRILVDAVLASVGGEHFEITVALEDAPRTKPHPDPYLRAAEALAASPTRCVVLEDSPTGVAAGEAAGCVVVAVPFAVPIPAAPGRHVVGSLADLSVARLRGLIGPAA